MINEVINNDFSNCYDYPSRVMMVPQRDNNMSLHQSSIYIGLLKLRKLLYISQFAMDKTERIVYGTPMMQSLRRAMGYFVVAFELKGSDLEERTKLMKECIGEFANVRMDLDFMQENNMFHFSKNRKERFKQGLPVKSDNVNKVIADVLPDVLAGSIQQSADTADSQDISTQTSNNHKKMTAAQMNANKRYDCAKWVEIYTVVAEIEKDVRKYYKSLYSKNYKV